jgi:competence protein ComEA
MWMILLQYRQRILIGLAALVLIGGGFLAGRATARVPERASGLVCMNDQLAAALPTGSPSAPGGGGSPAASTLPRQTGAIAASGAASAARGGSPVAPAASAAAATPPGASPTAATAAGDAAAPQAAASPGAGAPAESAAAKGAGSAASAANGAGRIDLNTATIEQLMELPRIGEAKAKAIIAYREQHGGFRTAYEITEVKGIGQKTYESFKDRITVSK